MNVLDRWNFAGNVQNGKECKKTNWESSTAYHKILQSRLIIERIL